MGVLILLTVIRKQVPVLHRDDLLISGSLFPLAAATLLATNLAALRGRRHGTDELFSGLPVSSTARVQAHLLSITWPVALALCYAGVLLVVLIAFGGVGSIRPAELLVGPLIVALAGTIGVLLASWWPTVSAAPIALLGLVTLQLYALVLTQSRSRWLAPWVQLSNTGPPDPELVIRPTSWHLLYLASLAIAVGVGATMRHGIGRRWIAVGLAALASVGVTAWIQTLPPSPQAVARLVALATRPEEHQRCELRANVRYCAYPAYGSWIDRWESAVEAAQRGVPMAERVTDLRVQQLLQRTDGSDLPVVLADELASGQGGTASTTVYLGTQWHRGAGELLDRLAISLPIAAWSVGLPIEVILTPDRIDDLVATYPQDEREEFRATLTPGDRWDSCHTVGQARAVVALWLAYQVDPEAPGRLRAAASDDALLSRNGETGELDYLGPLVAGGQTGLLPAPGSATIEYGRDEASYALQLLDEPRSEVTETIQRLWTTLISPMTSTEQLVHLLGLQPLPNLQERLVGAGMSAERARGIRDSDYLFTVRC